VVDAPWDAPVAVLIATEGELEGSLNTWVAFVASLAFAVSRTF
jgi:hypothetical protein